MQFVLKSRKVNSKRKTINYLTLQGSGTSNERIVVIPGIVVNPGASSSAVAVVTIAIVA